MLIEKMKQAIDLDDEHGYDQDHEYKMVDHYVKLSINLSVIERVLSDVTRQVIDKERGNHYE